MRVRDHNEEIRSSVPSSLQPFAKKGDIPGMLSVLANLNVQPSMQQEDGKQAASRLTQQDYAHILAALAIWGSPARTQTSATGFNTLPSSGDLAERLLRDMHRAGFPVDIKLLDLALRCHTRRGDMLKGSIFVRSFVYKAGLRITEPMLDALLEGFVDTDDPIGGIQMIKRMKEEFLWHEEVKHSEYTRLVAAFARRKKPHEALQAFRRLEKMVPIGIPLFNALLSALSKTENPMELSLSVLEDIKVAGLEPDQTTYTCVITSCMRAGRFDAAEAIISHMESQPLGIYEPGVTPYVAYMQGLVDADRCQDARDVMLRLPLMGLDVDGRVFYVLLQGYYTTRDLDACEDIWFLMRKHDIRIERRMYLIVLQVHLIRQAQNQALAVYRSMLKDNVMPDRRFFTVFIQACMNPRNLWMQELVFLCEEMVRVRCLPTNALMGKVARFMKETSPTYNAEGRQIQAIWNKAGCKLQLDLK
jgi:pentatricopeptide repeat protein